MSAEVLREAARLMRERAGASQRFIAGEGWWAPDALHEAFDAYWGDGDSPLPGAHEDAEHLAPWSPDLALALALWLDACALVEEVAPTRIKANALAVARAYLGESS